MRINYITIMFLGVVMFSCSDKTSRILKRDTKIIRKSDVLKRIVYEGEVSNKTLLLRKNGLFDLESSLLLKASYYAGIWNVNNDTLKLRFFDGREPDANYLIEGDKLYLIDSNRMKIDSHFIIISQ